jgi:hypothetical protein
MYASILCGGRIGSTTDLIFLISVLNEDLAFWVSNDRSLSFWDALITQKGGLAK